MAVVQARPVRAKVRKSDPATQGCALGFHSEAFLAWMLARVFDRKLSLSRGRLRSFRLLGVLSNLRLRVAKINGISGRFSGGGLSD